jgi:hypothetical protein
LPVHAFEQRSVGFVLEPEHEDFRRRFEIDQGAVRLDQLEAAVVFKHAAAERHNHPLLPTDLFECLKLQRPKGGFSILGKNPIDALASGEFDLAVEVDELEAQRVGQKRADG